MAETIDERVHGGEEAERPRLEEAERTAEAERAAAIDAAKAHEAAATQAVGEGGVDAANLDDNYFAVTPDAQAEAQARATPRARNRYVTVGKPLSMTQVEAWARGAVHGV